VGRDLEGPRLGLDQQIALIGADAGQHGAVCVQQAGQHLAVDLEHHRLHVEVLLGAGEGEGEGAQFVGRHAVALAS
jgi:hypothetical protein